MSTLPFLPKSKCVATLLCLFAILLATTAKSSSATLRFAAIGDSGTGEQIQHDIAARMKTTHQANPWEFVLMLGDNIYPNGDPADFKVKFKDVYKGLDIPFHATLGNHDRETNKGFDQVNDDDFGYVQNKDEYTFEAGPMLEGKRLARFICLNSGAWRDKDSLTSRERQLDAWLADSSKYHWNLVFFHHPLYSYAHTGLFHWIAGNWGHGSDKKLRKRWERKFIAAGIDVVLSGHDHFYQKIKPQHGIHYFVSGAAGEVRHGIKEDPTVEFGAETPHFIEFEVNVHQIQYRAIDQAGKVHHSGVIAK